MTRLLVGLLLRLDVQGLENVPPPPFIIASNHQAWYDTAFILLAIRTRARGVPAARVSRDAGPEGGVPPPVMVYTMARRDTVFNRAWKRWLMPRLGIFPIVPNRGELDQRGVATVYQVLSRGGVVLIFPEGRYLRGRALRPLKAGVAHFALQAGVPILPVALSGADRLRPFGRVEVSIGPPIRPDPPAWWTLNRRVARMVDRVRRAILRAFRAEAGGGRRWAGLRALRRLPARFRGRLRRAVNSSRDNAIGPP